MKALTNSPFHLIMAVTAVFMLLNAFLPLNFSAQAEATEYPFKLVMNLEKTTYKLGERVNVTCTLINIGTENVTLYYSCDVFDFEVYDENFNHVYSHMGYHGVLAVVYPLRTIPPSSNYTWKSSWKQIYDGSGDIIPGLWLEEVPPGIYYVTGVFLGSAYNITIETSAIRINVIGT